MKSQCQAKAEQISELKVQLEQKQTEIAIAQQKHTGLLQQNNDLVQKIETLKQELAGMEQAQLNAQKACFENKKTLQQIAAYEEQIKKLEETIYSHKGSDLAQKQEIERLAAQCAELSSRLQQTSIKDVQIEDHVKKHQSLLEAIAEKESMVQSLQSQLNAAILESKQSKDKIVEKFEEVQQERTKLEDLNQQFSFLEQKMIALQNQVA